MITLTDEQEVKVIALCETLIPDDHSILDYNIKKNPARKFNKRAAVYILELEVADPEGKKLASMKLNLKKILRDVKCL